MVFWIYYPDETRERYEEYSPDLLCIKVMQLIMSATPNVDANTQRVQCGVIIASLLFEGIGRYPHDNPLFSILSEKF